MATKYLIAPGGNWSSDACWSTTSGGSNDTTHPTVADDVICNAASTGVTLTITTGDAGLSLNCTGFTGTLAMGTQTLAISGNVTIDTTMSITGTAATGQLTVNASATLTSNTKTWPVKLAFAGASQTFTLADSWTCSGLVSFGGTGTQTVNGSSITCANGIYVSTTTDGTTTLTLTGGSWKTQAWYSLSTTLAGNITLGSGSEKPFIRNCTLTYSSGAITQGTNPITLSALNADMTLNITGVTWYQLTFASGGVGAHNFVLNSAITATTINLGDDALNFTGSYGWTCADLAKAALTAGRTYTLTQTNTYTVTNSITLVCVTGARVTLASSSGSLRVPLTFSGSTQDLQYVNATRIDSSGGNKIYSNGTLTDSLNWEAPSSGGTVSAVFNVTP